MKLQERIDLFASLRRHLDDGDEAWRQAKEKAFQQNPWFTPNFIQIAADNIAHHFLQPERIQSWCVHYHLDDNISPKNIGIVMAGNIPLVGFHDLMCVFICGHRQTIKLSSKDNVLIQHVIDALVKLEPRVQNFISTSELLKGCDAYIATGSNNSARYFEFYFSKYPSIIRRNKTSVAVIKGDEDLAQLEALSDDIHLYFGLGCRNVTKIFVPVGYDFIPLLGVFKKYSWFRDHHKYANNYDYQLSILLLNNVFYMTDGSTILTENPNSFSPISMLHYEYYHSPGDLDNKLAERIDLQCISGTGDTALGRAQQPGLFAYADNTDTLQFLLGL